MRRRTGNWRRVCCGDATELAGSKPRPAGAGAPGGADQCFLGGIGDVSSEPAGETPCRAISDESSAARTLWFRP